MFSEVQQHGKGRAVEQHPQEWEVRGCMVCGEVENKNKIDFKGFGFFISPWKNNPNNAIDSLVKYSFPQQYFIGLGSKQLLWFTVEF